MQTINLENCLRLISQRASATFIIYLEILPSLADFLRHRSVYGIQCIYAHMNNVLDGIPFKGPSYQMRFAQACYG
jgi:hypothetical protein